MNGNSKIFTLAKVSSDLEISTAFEESLEVLFRMHLFRCEVLHFGSQSPIRKQGSLHLGESWILPFITSNMQFEWQSPCICFFFKSPKFQQWLTF